jgi:hypothetical protein
MALRQCAVSVSDASLLALVVGITWSRKLELERGEGCVGEDFAADES